MAIQTDNISDPAFRCFSVTPSDAADLPFLAAALLITAAGNVSIVSAGNDTVTIPIPASALPYTLPVQVARVRVTGTTVAPGNIFALS